MSLRPSLVLLVSALVVLTACGEDSPPDGGTPDSGITPDGGGDGGTPDGGPPEDGGTPDGGPPGDGGTPDGGGTPRCVVPPASWGNGGVMWGTALSDEVLDVVIDSEANVFVAGYENGITGQTNVDPSGDAHAVLVKLATGASGLAPVWKKEFDTTGTDTLEALAFHPDTGKLHFAGRTTGAFPGFTHRGQQDLFLGGPGSASDFEVLYQGGSETPQHPRRLHFDAARDLIVTGFDDIYIPSNYVDKWEDPFVAKLRREGDTFTVQWWWQFNTPHTDMLGGAAVDARSTSSIYITGVNAAGAQRGTFAQKIDTDGKSLWFQRQTPVGIDMMQAAEMLPDGHVAIAGSTFALLGDQAYGQQDIVVRKLDAATGAPLWTFQFGTEESEWVTDLAVDAQGNLLVVGQTSLALKDGYEPLGEMDVFLVKVNPEGRLLNVFQWGSAGEDYPAAVAVDACGEAVIGGFTTGDLFGPSQGARDAFLVTTAPSIPAAGGVPGTPTLPREAGWCGGTITPGEKHPVQVFEKSSK